MRFDGTDLHRLEHRRFHLLRLSRDNSGLCESSEKKAVGKGAKDPMVAPASQRQNISSRGNSHQPSVPAASPTSTST